MQQNEGAATANPPSCVASFQLLLPYHCYHNNLLLLLLPYHHRFKSLVSHNCSPSPCCSCSSIPAGWWVPAKLPELWGQEGRFPQSHLKQRENWNTRLSSAAGHPDGEREPGAALPLALPGRGWVQLWGGSPQRGNPPVLQEIRERGDLRAGFIPIPLSREFSWKVLIWAL